MRKPIAIDWTAPMPINCRIGTAVEAYVFGSVPKGTANENSDLDVYVAGTKAEEIENRFALIRPLVEYDGAAYPMHVTGPSTTDLDTFLSAQPEAVKIQ